MRIEQLLSIGNVFVRVAFGAVEQGSFIFGALGGFAGAALGLFGSGGLDFLVVLLQELGTVLVRVRFVDGEIGADLVLEA